MRINRYIVGCKYFSFLGCSIRQKGINRYIVGCKYELTNNITVQIR